MDEIKKSVLITMKIRDSDKIPAIYGLIATIMDIDGDYDRSYNRYDLSCNESEIISVTKDLIKRIIERHSAS